MSSGNPYNEINFLRSSWKKIKSRGIDPRYYTYRLKWNFLGIYPMKTKVPTHVDIELSSACNLKCVMCPHGVDGYGLQKGFMDFDLAQKVISECVSFGITSIKFSGRGEQLLHPKFTDLVKYAKSSGILDVMFNTNGLLLTKDKIKSVVRSGVDLIIISIDGATKETYEKIRVSGNYDKLVHNINALIDYRSNEKSSKPMIRLQFVKMKENLHEFEEFQRMWKNKVDVLVGLDYSNRSAQNDKSVKNKKAICRAYCPHPWRRLTVTSSGKVLMCCADWDIKYAVGDSRTENIYEIWNGKKIMYGRKCIANLEHDKIPSCKDCFAPISYKWAESNDT